MAQLPSSVQSGIYTALIITALVISIMLMLSLALSPMVFIGIFAFYMAGCTGYLYAYVIMNKNKLNPPPGNEIKYTIADYMALFNTVLSVFVFIMCIVIASMRRRRLGLDLIGPAPYHAPLM